MSEVIHTRGNAQRPTGSDFFVMQEPFIPHSGMNIASISPESGPQAAHFTDWPMLYILTNEEEAYVGQTRSVKERMGQHSRNPEKGGFTTANIIYHPEFNHSVLDQYEHQLIEHMSADGRYRLTNGNAGIRDSNYFSKAEYTAMFEDLWDRLRELQLTDKTLKDIEESEVFKYSPFKALNVDQRIALDEITTAIAAGFDLAKPIVVEGMPGTGKTVLAVYLLKLLKDDPKYANYNIRLLEPVTSLRKTLQNSFKAVMGLSPRDVIGPTDLVKAQYGFKAGEKGIDILLIDEAHKLKKRKNLSHYKAHDTTCGTLGLDKEATQLDWVLATTKLPVFFFDPMQVIGPSGIGEDAMRETLGDCVSRPIRLESQMRVQGGNDYLSFITALLDDEKVEKRSFNGYELVLHRSFEGFVDSFEERLANHPLTRMIAGYAWKWKTKGKRFDEDLHAYDIKLEGIEKRWNFQLENWVGLGIDNDLISREVGCIHSIQGYDLSYAYVIIGNDLRYDPVKQELAVDKGSYFDVKGKNSTTLDELIAYIKNIYYVLLTRGIYGTHIYVCDDALREHLSHVMHVVD